MNTFGSIAQRTNTIAAGRPKPRPRMAKPEPAIATSSMDLPNRAGQKGPVPVKGIINGLVKRG